MVIPLVLVAGAMLGAGLWLLLFSLLYALLGFTSWIILRRMFDRNTAEQEMAKLGIGGGEPV